MYLTITREREGRKGGKEGGRREGRRVGGKEELCDK